MNINGFNRNNSYLKKVEKVYRLAKRNSNLPERENKKPYLKPKSAKNENEDKGKNLDLML